MDYPFDSNAAWFNARAMLELRHRREAPVRVLDIGCHTGAFLAGLSQHWLKHGIEGGSAPARVAADRHRIQVIGERIESVESQWHGKFDAVTLFDVVEHLVDPGDALMRAAALLRPGGSLVVSSGDLDAWTWRWLGTNHWYLQSPQHISVISQSFLKHFAARAQLRTREVRRIPHRFRPRGHRIREAVEALNWGMRCRRGLFRFPQRLLQSLPRFQDIRYRESVPWTMSLADHVVALIERP